MIEFIEEEYFKEQAYLQAKKDIENWWEWEEELKKQKPAKIELLTEIKHVDTEQVHRDS